MPRVPRLIYDFMQFNGQINSFDGEYECFSPEYKCEFIYFGSKWSCIQEAYNGLVEDNFDDHQKIRLMGNILYHYFFQDENRKNILLNTKSVWIEKKVENHDNFWHNCCCKECFFENGNNYYGRLLMEVRDRFIWENKEIHPNANRKWKQKYF